MALDGDTLHTFNIKLRAFRTEVEKQKFPAFHKKVILTFAKGVIFGTPVDEGRARGDWQANVGSPIEEESGRLDPGRGGATLQLLTRQLTGLPPFVTVWVTNNVPYINRLNDEGHSPQAAPGWVEDQLQRAAAMFGG